MALIERLARFFEVDEGDIFRAIRASRLSRGEEITDSSNQV